jgi:hypothetical protein
MQLTPEQLRTVEEALEYSCSTLSDEFEDNKYSRETTEIQRAVEVYGRIRRYNRLLNELRRCGVSPRETDGNNVLAMASKQRYRN